MPLISTDHHSLAVGKPQVPGFNEKDLKRSAQNKTFSLFFTDHLLVRLYHEERMQCCSNAATRKQASCQDLVRWKKKIRQSLHLFLAIKPQVLIRIPNHLASFGCQTIWWPFHDCSALPFARTARILALESRAHLGQQSYQ